MSSTNAAGENNPLHTIRTDQSNYDQAISGKKKKESTRESYIRGENLPKEIIMEYLPRKIDNTIYIMNKIGLDKEKFQSIDAKMKKLGEKVRDVSKKLLDTPGSYINKISAERNFNKLQDLSEKKIDLQSNLKKISEKIKDNEKKLEVEQKRYRKEVEKSKNEDIDVLSHNKTVENLTDNLEDLEKKQNKINKSIDSLNKEIKNLGGGGKEGADFANSIELKNMKSKINQIGP